MTLPLLVPQKRLESSTGATSAAPRFGARADLDSADAAAYGRYDDQLGGPRMQRLTIIRSSGDPEALLAAKREHIDPVMEKRAAELGNVFHVAARVRTA